MKKQRISIKKIRKINWANRLAELLVVFLGVSAGFILQNYKENLQDEKLEQNYIASFIDDVNTNILSLRNQITEDSLWIENNSYAIRFIFKDSLSYDSACSLVRKMVMFSEFSEQTDTYEDIISSGNLNLIKNYTVKKEIISYYKSLKDIEILDVFFKNYFSDDLMPFVMHKYDLVNKKIIPIDAYKSIEFVNIYVGYFSYSQQRMNTHKELLEQSTNLRNLLKEY